MMKYLKLLPVQLVLCIVVAFLIGTNLNQTTVQFFYSISLAFKDVLMFVLPVVIFSYITAALLSLEQRAPLLLASILILLTLSNALAVFISYGVSIALLPSFIQPSTTVLSLTSLRTIEPLWEWVLPTLISPDKAMLTGISFGLFFNFFRVPTINSFTLKLRDSVNSILHRTLIPFLPLYVFGFVLKLQYEGSLGLLVHSYAQVFIMTVTLILTYLSLFYLVGSGFQPRKALRSIQTMFPAGITAFCTMSSAATMPVTIEATEKNLKNPAFADLIIPTTVNNHLIGDALGLPLMGLAILLVNGQPFPALAAYAIFVVYFCLAKFSTAGIPGGGVIVLLPVLQTHMGLTPEMLSLITTLYILQDSIFTSANVMGNGAFAMICERVLVRLVPSQPQPQPVDFPVTVQMVQQDLKHVRKTG
jgi:Na+/H+-dicarboxylate symporter